MNGRNYRPSRKADPEAGNWRIEVEPREPGDAQEFLHVLYACEHAREPMPPVRLVQDRNQVGVRGQAGGVAYEVRFNRAGPGGGSVRLTRGRDQVVARDFPHTIIQDRAGDMLERWSAAHDSPK